MYKILAKTLFIGKKVFFLPTCHSTNEAASDMMQNDAVIEGSIFITNEQTNGRGQRGNVWQAEPGKNLTFSLVLKPIFLLASRQFDLNMAISLGMVDYLNKIVAGFKVKWPNDIYFKEKKIAGILINNSIKLHAIDASIVGIGLNVNQTDFSYHKAISLIQILNSKQDLQSVLEGICQGIENRYMQLRNGRTLKHDYLNKMLGYNQNRMFRSETVFEGKIIDIDSIGRLVIQSDQQLHSFNFKEVEFL